MSKNVLLYLAFSFSLLIGCDRYPYEISVSAHHINEVEDGYQYTVNLNNLGATTYRDSVEMLVLGQNGVHSSKVRGIELEANRSLSVGINTALSPAWNRLPDYFQGIRVILKENRDTFELDFHSSEKSKFDSCFIYRSRGIEQRKAKAFRHSLHELEKAFPFANSSPDSAAIHFEMGRSWEESGNRTRALRHFKRANALDPSKEKESKVADLHIQLRQYSKALSILEKQISRTSAAQLNYARALYYTGKREEAALAANKAVRMGAKGAKDFYEIANPWIIRRGNPFHRCCDGSTSNAMGRGSCSHHGGVCGTEYPTYKERKYNIRER